MDKAYMGFKKLKQNLAHRKGKSKVKDPAAVAAAIGRKKYSASKFNAAAHAGKKMKGMHKNEDCYKSVYERLIDWMGKAEGKGMQPSPYIDMTDESLDASEKKVRAKKEKCAAGDGKDKKKMPEETDNEKAYKSEGDIHMSAFENLVDWIEKAKAVKKLLAHTKSGKSIFHEGNRGAKGWSSQDHLDAYHAHTEQGMHHHEAMTKHPVFQHVRNSDPHFYLTPEQTMARVSQHHTPEAKQLVHHERMSNHHHALADQHYQKFKKLGGKVKGLIKKCS